MYRLEDMTSSGLAGRTLAMIKRVRPLSAAAWRLLRLWQRLSNSAPDVLHQLKSIDPALPPGDRTRVLIFSLRGWTTHLAWETTLARALHVRSAETLTVLCDRALPACEPRTVGNDFESTCDRCMAQSAKFLERTALPFQWLSTYLQPTDYEKARSISELDLHELQDFTDDGVPIGSLVAASVNRHLLRGTPTEPSADYVETYRRFVAAGIIAARAGARLLGSFRPRVVLVLNGLFYAEAIMMYLARGQDIPVFAYERAKRVDALIFARNEPVVSQSFDTKWMRRRGSQLGAEQNELLNQYLAARTAGHVGIERLWSEQVEWNSHEDRRPVAALFTNVLWDTAMFDSDIAFESMIGWILHTIDWFARHPDRRLVIRIHPAEVRVAFKESRDRVADRIAEAVGELPENVQVLDAGQPFDSYALLATSSIALVYASTIGLEAALQSIPTVVAGRTHYRGRGFTSDPHNAAEYDEALESAFGSGRIDDSATELARRYAWMYFFEEILPFPLVHEEPRSYVTLRYRSNQELQSGRDATLDIICDALLSGDPITLPDQQAD